MKVADKYYQYLVDSRRNYDIRNALGDPLILIGIEQLHLEHLQLFRLSSILKFSGQEKKRLINVFLRLMAVEGIYVFKKQLNHVSSADKIEELKPGFSDQMTVF